MKLRHWFADQVVERSQELCDLYVRLDDCKSTETEHESQELQRKAIEDTLLRDLREAHSRWQLAIRSFEDILVNELVEPPDDEANAIDPPWDF